MGLGEVKKELKKLEKDKLIALIAELYKKNKSVKEFLDVYANPNQEGELLLKYKEKVLEAFYPKRGYTYKLKDGKQAIIDFRKIGSSVDALADLMLFYVETGVKFTNDFGDMDERFYLSMGGVFADALALMEKEDLLDNFADRADKVVSDTGDVG